ncbi:hypothetical protein niasHT_025106 [Heterodera trifolii]|uniref:Uncharacterized protein n=1 Tax=Heterodera trifolii TaxID=157864 RepID=A0ABD2K1F2_9BILA
MNKVGILDREQSVPSRTAHHHRTCTDSWFFFALVVAKSQKMALKEAKKSEAALQPRPGKEEREKPIIGKNAPKQKRIVEFDETHVLKKKYWEGCVLEKQDIWLFGGVDATPIGSVSSWSPWNHCPQIA